MTIFFSVLILLIIIYFLLKKRKSHQLSECGLCHKPIWEREISVYDEIPICKAHAGIFTSTKWCLYKSAVSTEQESEAGIKLYDTKQFLLSNNVYSYFKSSYKIENEIIVTTLSLYLPCHQFQIADEILKKRPI